MTPEEMFVCRLAIAMGKSPSQIRQMGLTDFNLLARYWDEEPWGAWRDNLHAAIIAREVRRPHVDPKHNRMADFMVRNPIDRIEQGQKQISGMFTLFKTVAKRVKASDIKGPKKRKRPKQTDGAKAQERRKERHAPTRIQPTRPRRSRA